MAFVSRCFLFSPMQSIACKIFGWKRKSSSAVIDSFLFFDEILRFLKTVSISLNDGIFIAALTMQSLLNRTIKVTLISL